jgi:hypothetical protein
MLTIILLTALLLMLIGVLPVWPYSRSWGYYPSGGVVLAILIVKLLLGKIE